MSDPQAPDQTSMTVMVRAAGRDLDDMGPPGVGRYYFVLEVPDGQNAMLQAALASGRIRVTGAQS